MKVILVPSRDLSFCDVCADKVPVPSAGRIIGNVVLRRGPSDVGVQVAQCVDLAIGGLGRRVRLVERHVVLEHLLLSDEAQVLLVLVTELVQDCFELVTLADNVHMSIRFLHLFTR